jgi:hypothetical protein
VIKVDNIYSQKWCINQGGMSHTEKCRFWTNVILQILNKYIYVTQSHSGGNYEASQGNIACPDNVLGTICASWGSLKATILLDTCTL